MKNTQNSLKKPLTKTIKLTLGQRVTFDQKEIIINDALIGEYFIIKVENNKTYLKSKNIRKLSDNSPVELEIIQNPPVGGAGQSTISG